MRILTLGVAFGLGAWLASADVAALAQQDRGASDRGGAGAGYGFDPSAGTPLTPHGEGGAGMIPPVERQYGAARQAGETMPSNSTHLLRRAAAALEGNDPGLANELLERASTALLNQPGVEAGREGVRSVGPGRAINEARAALAANDIPNAKRSVEAGLAAIRHADGAPAGTAIGGSR